MTQHPAVIAQQGERARSLQPLIGDAITAYAGSMAFVYVHAVGFAVWMLFIESNPWPKLTLIVSLEAIFLSTFVMIPPPSAYATSPRQPSTGKRAAGPRRSQGWQRRRAGREG